VKTLHIDCGREMAGGQWQVLYLVERLADAILFARLASPLFQEARTRGMDVRPVSVAAVFQAARGVDLVHAHDSRAHSLGMVCRGARLVVSRRVGFPARRGVLSDFKYDAAQMFVAVSQCAAARMRERGVDESKIRVVYDGVPIPARASSGSGGVVVIAKGRADEAMEAARAIGVPVRVVTDLWQDLATASVCVYLSEMEGLGSGALAAMASGVPVIASRAGGLPEVIEHEKTGLLIEGRDFGAALRRILENPALAAEMGRNARRRVQEKFSVEHMVDETRRVYAEVLK
jgi:Glycosyl transferases group 1/Glycosyltransferase Family 4